jgi:hypothetical protein
MLGHGDEMSARTSAPRDYRVPCQPRRCLRLETDLCPKVPTDFEAARVEAIMEQYGWPIEDDDAHPAQAKARRLEQQLEELDALYYDEWMETELAYAEMDIDDRDTEFFDSHLDYGDYGDEPYEALRRNPLTNTTYDDWYD